MIDIFFFICFLNLKTSCALQDELQPFGFQQPVFCCYLVTASSQQASTAVATLGRKGLNVPIRRNVVLHSRHMLNVLTHRSVYMHSRHTLNVLTHRNVDLHSRHMLNVLTHRNIYLHSRYNMLNVLTHRNVPLH